MTARECLASAIRLEERSRELYEVLALRHGREAELRQFFTAMALEEEQHTARLHSLARHLTAAELDMAAPAHLAETMAAMDAEIVAILAEDERLGPAGLASVLQRLVDFENWYTGVHAENLCDLFAPTLKRLFSSLAEQDRTHHDLLHRVQQALAGVRSRTRAESGD